MAQISSHLSTSWLDTIPQSWIRERQSIYERGLTVTHDFQPASEVTNLAGWTDHVLSIAFDANSRQITRMDGREFDGFHVPGDLLMLPAGMPSFHYWECDRAEETISFYVKPQLLQQLATENDCAYSSSIELRPILQGRDPQIEAIATAFRLEMYNDEFGSKLYSESLANLFLIHLLRNYCTQDLTLRVRDRGLSHDRLQTALDFIHDRLSTEFKLQDIAQELGIGQYHFSRLFKQSIGISPYQYVIQQRVECAKRLLKQEEKSIADIALASGFSSQSQMTQHFRKLTGTTPSLYRRN
jgi:AraC family transcriptional regulator